MKNDSEDFIDFHIKYNDSLQKIIDTNPNVFLGEMVEDYAIVYVRRGFENTFLEATGGSRIHIYAKAMGLLGIKDLDASGINKVQTGSFLNLKGQDVMMAFIDTGIDWTNTEFCYEDGTSKIAYIWDQTLKGTTPQGHYFGVEFNNKELNEALKSSNPKEKIPHTDENGHGTFLASIAGSRNKTEKIGVAPNSEFIIVKLRKLKNFYYDFYTIDKNINEVYSSADLMLGINYALKKANELKKPLAICIGVGTTFGSHDGFSVLEDYINNISKRVGTCVCIAAGNESQEKHHVTGILTKDKKEDSIDIKVEADTHAFSVWLWNTLTDRFSVAITSPTGELVARIPAKNGLVSFQRLTLEKSSVEVSYFFPIEGSGAQLTIIKIFDPTGGIWRINVYGDIVLSGTYHAWLPLSSLASKSVEFIKPNPNWTLTLPATAVGGMCIGGYNTTNNSLYLNSSWGPTTLPYVAPDFVAPSVDVEGLFPLGKGMMSGTSVAAAFSTGVAALMLEWGIIRKNDARMNTYHIKAYLIRGCKRDVKLAYPNDEWGYGILDLANAFELLKGN